MAQWVLLLRNYSRYKLLFKQEIQLQFRLNSQYHDYAVLFKSWFGSDIEPKIIESAIMYWFRDEDFKDKNKVYKYFMEA